MRIDLIPERDRFIPGWHNWPEPCQAEQFSPKWRRPGRLPGAVRALLGGLLEACYAIHPQHCWTTRGPVPGDSVWQTAPLGKQARRPIAIYDFRSGSVTSLVARWSARPPQLQSGGQKTRERRRHASEQIRDRPR